VLKSGERAAVVPVRARLFSSTGIMPRDCNTCVADAHITLLFMRVFVRYYNAGKSQERWAFRVVGSDRRSEEEQAQKEEGEGERSHYKCHGEDLHCTRGVQMLVGNEATH